MSQPIERKIHDFSPYLVTARYHNKWFPYRVYVGYSYLGELAVLLAGLGLASPVSALIARASAAPVANSGTAAQSIGQLGWGAFLLLVVWLCVKVYVQQESLEKRCSLLTSYRRQCRQIEFELGEALRASDPMPELIQLKARLRDLIDRSIAEDAIVGVGVDDRWSGEWERFSNDLITRHSANWSPAPNTDRRERKEGDGQ